VTSLNDTSGDTDERAALVHRELLQLAALLIVAVATFALTRAVAASNHDRSLRDAAEWYRRGQQQLERRQLDAAIDDFRRATVRDRAERRYVLALARALTLKQDYEAARSALLTLRESAPEDPDINLELARLAAERQDVTEAVRYYHNALYAAWPSDQTDARRRVRLELIRFLLTRGQVGRAQAELLSLAATDLPDDAATRLDVARLFATAGDATHALDQFQRTLLLAPENRDALLGAGTAAFHLGNYLLARTYLHRAPSDVEDIGRTREIVDLVLSDDPLANRIGSSERRRRLVEDFTYAEERLTVCLAQRGGRTDAMTVVQSDMDTFADQLKPRDVMDQDTIEAGVDLIDRIEHQVEQQCGPLTARDQALLLIGRQHGADAR
jgi:tetratricopeptide (TPR) repeat protein